MKRVNTKPYCESRAENCYEQSPWLAFLVPGMGQVYNDDWQKGWIIFLSNGASESATVPPGYLPLAIKFGIVPFACVHFGGIFVLLTGFVSLVKLLLKLD